MASKKRKPPPKWRLVTKFDVTQYGCGLKSGEILRLRQTLRCEDQLGIPTGQRYNRGGRWRVLRGSNQDPGVVFLWNPKGKKHTWDDDPGIYEWFESVVTGRNNG